MPQATRNTADTRRAPRPRRSMRVPMRAMCTRCDNNYRTHFGVFVVGMLSGALVTLLLLGWYSPGSGLGAGLRALFADSPAVTPTRPIARAPDPANSDTSPARTDFDFYTRLQQTPDANTDTDTNPDRDTNTTATQAATSPTHRGYVIQVGAYHHRHDAVRAQTRFAQQGYTAYIEDTTVAGHGAIYRVRLGPYPDDAQSMVVQQQLAARGIDTLRLQIAP